METSTARLTWSEQGRRIDISWTFFQRTLCQKLRAASGEHHTECRHVRNGFVKPVLAIHSGRHGHDAIQEGSEACSTLASLIRPRWCVAPVDAAPVAVLTTSTKLSC